MNVPGFLSIETGEIALMLIALGGLLLTILAVVFIVSKKPINAESIAWLIVVIFLTGIGPLIYFIYRAFNRNKVNNNPVIRF